MSIYGNSLKFVMTFHIGIILRYLVLASNETPFCKIIWFTELMQIHHFLTFEAVLFQYLYLSLANFSYGSTRDKEHNYNYGGV